jgi:hypothetical protein
MSRRAEQIAALFDFAADKPEGFTYIDVRATLGWQRDQFVKVARQLRLVFADDQINLVCEPQGSCEPWRYKLVGNVEDARAWSSNRIGDIETRLETIKAVAETLTNATDGRTIEGRKARKIHRTLGYLIGELSEIDGVGA